MERSRDLRYGMRWDGRRTREGETISSFDFLRTALVLAFMEMSQ